MLLGFFSLWWYIFLLILFLDLRWWRQLLVDNKLRFFVGITFVTKTIDYGDVGSG